MLENGTPGSVRGRFGQLAVLPRWRTNQRSPVRCEESCQIGNSWHFWLLGDSSWVYLPGISLSDPARDLAESASRHHLRFRRPIKVVPTLNCLPSVIDGRRFVCVLVLGNVSNAPVYVPTMSDLYINDVSGPVLPPWGEWLLEMGRANKPYVEYFLFKQTVRDGNDLPALLGNGAVVTLLPGESIRFDFVKEFEKLPFQTGRYLLRVTYHPPDNNSWAERISSELGIWAEAIYSNTVVVNAVRE